MADRPIRRPHLLRRAVALVGLLTLVAVLAGCAGASGAFVTRSGRQLLVDGKPFRFVGFNLYDAAATDGYSCSPTTRLDDAALANAMQWIHDEAGATVLRFWAYQSYTAGGTDYSGTDRVIAAAKKAGLRVIPVLEDGPGDCSTGAQGMSLAQAAGGRWYTDGYRRPLGRATLSYRDYVRRIAEHYRDSPTILAWMMVNEAETNERDASGTSALVPFAADISSVIKAVDQRHLVTLGTQGNGAPGGSGTDFAAIYAQSGLDFAEVHDWGRYGSDTEAMPGSVNGALPAPDSDACHRGDAKIACSFAIAKQLDKPIIVGEAGIQATDAAGRTRRALLLGAKMDAAFAAGASGYLIWHLDRASTDQLDVILGSDDPLFPAMKQRAATLIQTG
ncbi:MAG: cellulase family glycosylhydrolase [Lapillicoccus sp.]